MWSQWGTTQSHSVAPTAHASRTVAALDGHLLSTSQSSFPSPLSLAQQRQTLTLF